MKNCNVRNYGAVGDGVTLDTKAIQAAIDDCAAHNGGQVIFEDGSFLCGFIQLKSGVELHIERDAVLLGSTNFEDFPDIETTFWRTEYAPRFNKRCFIYAEGCEDIGITGRGAIDCQGEAFVYPIPEEEATLWSYRRHPHPVDPNGDGMVHYPDIDWPLDPNRVSLSPGRVVMFIGCRNILVEDVTMRNQPAGWSYWICDCDNVHFHRAQVLASVEFPNNDGIHINCSRSVTISDCNITCGDDGIVVRAYSRPMYEHRVCEKVAVTNCNITSHACGVRIGWYGDGVIRNCTFSNLNITDSNRGLTVFLPGNTIGHRGSDEGDEATLIENLSFSNITMDNIYRYPLHVCVAEHNLCTAIRNIYFSNVHAFSAEMPVIMGREDCHLRNIYLDQCHFAQIRYQDIPNKFGMRLARRSMEAEDRSDKNFGFQAVPCFQHVDNLVLNGTVFSVL